jgi:ATP-dependent DNA ligase
MTTTSLIAFAPQLLASKADSSSRSPVMPDHREWIMEPKLDGWRWQATITEDGVVCAGGRNGKVWSCPPIEAAMQRLPAGTIFDGELLPIEAGHQSTKVPHLLARGGTGLQYVVFDVLQVAGQSAMHLKWRERRLLLEKLAEHFDGELVRTSPFHPWYDPEIIEGWISLGLEGAVCKDPEARYTPGRGRAWVKVKPQLTDDATVIGFEPGKGKYADMIGALRLRMVDTGVETTASGMDDATRLDMTRNPTRWIGVRVEIAHHGLHPESRVPRHPQYKRIREDLM